MAYIYTLAFTIGLVIMGTELTAARFVAPYFGTSTIVWTNVIAVIMVALSLGYLSGGRLIERENRPGPLTSPARPGQGTRPINGLRSFQKSLLIGSVALAAIPYISSPLADLYVTDLYKAAGGSIALFAGSFVLVLLLFFIPVYLLAMTSPFLIGYLNKKGDSAGIAAGRIFAISTVGSILGTFLPTVLLVPTFGTKRTMLIFAGVLFLLTAPEIFNKTKIVAIALIGPTALVPLTIDPDFRHAETMIASAESAYQYVQVYQHNNVRSLVFNEGGGVQSLLPLNGVTSGHTYFDALAMTPALLKTEPLEILMLGLSGGTIAREIDLLYPNRQLHITGVEIDPQVTKLARAYFDLDRERLDVVNMDARAYLMATDKKFDLIIIDAYSNQIYLPYHLVSEQFFELVKNRMNPEGLVAFNVNARNQHSKLLNTLTNTLAKVFPRVHLAPIPDYWNYIVIASNANDPGATEIPKELVETADLVLPKLKQTYFDSSLPIFTDDWAPVEWMTDSMIWEYLNE